MFWQMQDVFSQEREAPFKWCYTRETLATLYSWEQTFAQTLTHTYARLTCHWISQTHLLGFSKPAGCRSLP